MPDIGGCRRNTPKVMYIQSAHVATIGVLFRLNISQVQQANNDGIVETVAKYRIPEIPVEIKRKAMVGHSYYEGIQGIGGAEL